MTVFFCTFSVLWTVPDSFALAAYASMASEKTGVEPGVLAIGAMFATAIVVLLVLGQDFFT